MPKVAACAAAPVNDAGLSALSVAGDTSASPANEGLATSEQCPECRGLGALTCPACDGTGMWTEASESAGLYQRETARATGHCAWCDEWGEVVCPECEGAGCCAKRVSRPMVEMANRSREESKRRAGCSPMTLCF